MRTLYLLAVLLLCLLGNIENVRSQCDQISFSFTEFEPCRFRLSYSNSTECYNEIRLTLEQGEFVSYNVGAGFSVQEISPSELWITHNQGFLPIGTQFPINFTLPFDLTTSIYVAYINYCPPGTGCELFPAPVLQSCPDPQDASIIGTKYRECGNLPFTNQPTVPDWVIQLQDTMGNVLAEQQTDSEGRYAIYDLPKGQYIVKELALPGWTPKVPASGEYVVDLGASQQVVRNFGNCNTNGTISGTIYRECYASPFDDQIIIPNSTVDLTDTSGNLISSTQADSTGHYLFADLPPGQYIVRGWDVNGHWTPSVPASGQYAISVSAGGNLLRDFGLCPKCSCDSLDVLLVQEPGLADTNAYYFETESNPYCFTDFTLTINNGNLVDYTQLDSTVIVEKTGPNTLSVRRFGKCKVPYVKMRIAGSGSQNTTISAAYDIGAGPVTCTREFQHLPNSPAPCCPAGTVEGPELVVNGNFEAGNTGFNSGHTYKAAGALSAGQYTVAQSNQVAGFNNQWACTDHTSGSSTGKMLLVDGSVNPPAITMVWHQNVSVVAGKTYTFSAWVNNLVIPSQNFNDPQVELYIDGKAVAGIILPETSDEWRRMCVQWKALFTGMTSLEVRIGRFNNTGNDFAVDDISFRACEPAPCQADFSVTNIDGCGQVQLVNTSTGVSPFTALWSNSSSGNTLDLNLPCGNYTYCMTVTDATNCTSTICKSFTISDNTPPKAVCAPGFGVELDPNCEAILTSGLIDGGSSDNCQIQSISISPAVLTGCGDFQVTLTVTDWCGNKSTCMTGVQTIEVEPPMIKCPPDVSAQGDPTIGGIQIPIPPPDLLSDNCSVVSAVTDYENGLFPCGSATLVTYTATDGCGNTSSCSFSVIVEDCEPMPVDTCCAFALHFVNKYTDGRIKYVRVTGLCDTKICCTDPDEWAEEAQYPYNVVWRPADGSPVPNGNAIDNDFLIYLSEAGLNSFQIEWIDQNETVVARHTIDISCDGMFDEDDEDWTKYTSITALDDPNLFVFAVRETSEDGESDCEPEEKLANSCSFTWGPITCSSPNYLVPLQGPSGYASYNWSVVLGPSYPSLSGGQNTSFMGMPGSYVISVQATDAAGKTCSGEEEIILPDVQPDFTWKFLDCPNNTAAEFTASSLDDVTNISWSAPGGTLSNSSSNPTTITFPSAGTYTVYLSATDIYGCTHTVSQSVTVDLNCKAGLEVEKFVFCPDNCAGANTTPVTVTFGNRSTGGKCPVTYKWDFGDGSTNTVTNKNDVSHTYTVPCPGGKQYSVTLTMTDADNNTCTETITADITPCEVDFTYIICPDGKVVFEGTHKGKWSFPGSHSEAPWPYSDKKDKDGNRKKVVVRYDQSGTYGVTFTGVCDNGGECTIVREIVIVLECCAKNDRKRDKFYFTGNSGGQFKMKYKFAQNQLPFFHHIKAKTWLKKKKTKAGISFWKNFQADEIEAALAGTVYKRDSDKCNCKIPETVPYTTSGVISAKKAKSKYSFYLTRFRSRKHTLTSTHYIKIESAPITKQLLLGEDCDKFRWWLDWF